MRRRRGAGMLIAMPGDSHTVRLVIHLYGSDDPIEGELIEPLKQATQFRGWLSLAALIESARKPDERGDHVPAR